MFEYEGQKRCLPSSNKTKWQLILRLVSEFLVELFALILYENLLIL